MALARALAPSPRLVLLDEPFSALDAALRVETRLAVAASLAAAGATAVLVTHDQPEALSMGQRVGVLRRGAMVQMATPETLYRDPADLELARFVGDAVVLRGDGRGDHVVCRFGSLDLKTPAEGPVDVLIRPEQVRLGHGSTPARVKAVRFQGPDASVTMQLADGTELTARVPGYATPTVGSEVPIEIDGLALAFAVNGGSRAAG